MNKKITESIYYVGVNDHDIDLFEGQYTVPEGMAYNSYIIKDKKCAIMDTVDARFLHEWLDNITEVLGSTSPDYLIVQHMEPDHSANIVNLLKTYPDITVVGNSKTFTMMQNFFGKLPENRLVVTDGNTLDLGEHKLTFVFAPMVHWPEVMVTYDSHDKVLFSADGFGKFGALDRENDDWACEARRYYFGIVGKYGAQVQSLLKKASALDINVICPLHGPVLTENLSYYINLYDIWSSYGIESDGIFIAYTSVYKNTEKAVMLLADKLKAKGCPKVVVTDLARSDMAEAVEDAFRYGKLVLATTTYNADVFPFMRTFIEALTERGYKNRTIGIIENGSWAPMAAKVIKEEFAASKNITFTQATVTLRSALSDDSKAQIEALSDELCKEYIASDAETANKNDPAALFKIGYGLYIVTSNDGKRDNGLIVNTVSQLTSSPCKIAVTINKDNYSHHIIKQTGIMNLNCISIDAPFKVFSDFGFCSGRNIDKFADYTVNRSENGLVFLNRYVNAMISLKVESYVDLGTHGMFICTVSESRVIGDKETMSYSYYQSNVKPKPSSDKKKGYVCKVCGYEYEGETLPDDFVCPLCKHGAADFEKLG